MKYRPKIHVNAATGRITATLLCSWCQARLATHLCEQCEQPLCDSCTRRDTKEPGLHDHRCERG